MLYSEKLAWVLFVEPREVRWYEGYRRRPIPPEWHYVGVRQSLLGGRNRHATHPVNVMLNYAYAVLESQVRIATVARGLDPTLDYLHAWRPGRVVLIYDLMEPLRPQVDYLVLDFVRSHTFAQATLSQIREEFVDCNHSLPETDSRVGHERYSGAGRVVLVTRRVEGFGSPYASRISHSIDSYLVTQALPM